MPIYKTFILVFILLIIALIGCIMIFSPKSPPVMSSIIETAKRVDNSELPPISYMTARDGTQIAYRFYSGLPNKVAVLVHGSSASSLAMHSLGKSLNKNGVTVYSLDVRGHGDSGRRGDISYVGQLEDDLSDLVSLIRTNYPDAPITLVGHSAGGGFALRVAGSPISKLFSQYILLSPQLNINSPTVRPAMNEWANASGPRLIGITILNQFGVHHF